MKLQLKSYKFHKIRYYFTNQNLFIIYNNLNVNNKNLLKINQNLLKHNLEMYKTYNNITKTFIKKSIFFNLMPFIKGSILLVNPAKNINIETYSILKEFQNENFCLLFIKLNNSIYLFNQIKNLIRFNYKKTVVYFYKTLKTVLKFPFYTLSK